MARYILVRILKSILSIAIVITIVMLLVYKLVPTSRIFEKDEAYRKLQGNKKTVYEYTRLESQGYLDFQTAAEMFAHESKDKASDHKIGDQEYERVLQAYRNKGYVVKTLDQSGDLRGEYIAYRNYNLFELVGRFFGNLVIVDHPNYIEDPANPDMERGYRIEKDQNGVYALACSGCEYKYQIYFNNKFPFIHQHVLRLNFGESYPTHAGRQTLAVISEHQGKKLKVEQTFPSGEKSKSPIDQHSRRYKFVRDRLDEKKYGKDPYAETDSMYDSPSMIGTSYTFGLFAILFAYLIAVPMGIAMARHKGKLLDKIGIVYINLLLAMPSLALIFFFKYLGYSFGFPDKFSQLGFHNIRSYILPIFMLGIMGTPGLMMWIRRYMVDQGSSDYVKFARAKGLSDAEISKRHIFKNAILPIVNGIPGSIILAMSGAVMTESLFAVPGMGKMFPDAINGANNNMVVTLAFIFTTLSVFSVMIGDLLMTIIDPRISLHVKEGTRK